MRIYVASSWRCSRQQNVVAALRDAGHGVYDFRNPAPGDHGFGWRQCATAEQLKNPRLFRDEVLSQQVARDAFAKDMCALRASEATVLVLPCGRSAHLELGWATGHGQRTLVLLDDPMSEPELMYLMNSRICTSIAEVVTDLAGRVASVESGSGDPATRPDRPPPFEETRDVEYPIHGTGHVVALMPYPVPGNETATECTCLPPGNSHHPGPTDPDCPQHGRERK